MSWNGVRRSNSLHALEPESAQTRVWRIRALCERWSVSEVPKGLRHQAPGREFELRTPPNHSLIPERQ